MEKLVEFRNKGQKLFGIMHYPDNSAKKKVPCVTLFHGFTGNRSEDHFLFTKLARALAKQGIAVFRFDFRGSGDSEGAFSDMTLEEELSDAKAALDFVKTQKNIEPDRLGLLGLSMGGFVCAYTAGNYPGIKSAVLMSAVARFWHLWRERLNKGGKNTLADGSIVFGGFKLNKDFLKVIKKYDGLNLKGIMSFEQPLLILHGENDPVVPVVDGKLYFEISTSLIKKLKIINNAGQTFGSRESERKAISYTVKWFKETL